MNRRLLVQILVFAALLAGVFLLRKCQQDRTAQEATVRTEKKKAEKKENRDRTPRAEDQSSRSIATKVPAYALDVLRYVQANDRAPEGYVGGREFQNRENRLPKKTPEGRLIHYREWDVHPKVAGQNRGAERLITGSDGSAWYTDDHYKTFESATEPH